MAIDTRDDHFDDMDRRRNDRNDGRDMHDDDRGRGRGGRSATFVGRERDDDGFRRREDADDNRRFSRVRGDDWDRDTRDSAAAPWDERGQGGRDLRERDNGGLGNQRGGDYNSRDGRGNGPHAGKGPKDLGRADDRIRDDVIDVLTDNGAVDASEIDVAVSKGEVTLTGTVADLAQKRAANDAAHHVRGVVDVHNQIKVQRAGAGGSAPASKAAKESKST